MMIPRGGGGDKLSNASPPHLPVMLLLHDDADKYAMRTDPLAAAKKVPHGLK